MCPTVVAWNAVSVVLCEQTCVKVDSQQDSHHEKKREEDDCKGYHPNGLMLMRKPIDN
jgi:hypothetical protein